MPVFESSVEDELGLWSMVPVTETVSFGLGDGPALPTGPVFRVNLSEQSADSDQAVREQEAALARMDSALSGIPAHLDGLVARIQTQAKGLSFDVLSDHQESDLDSDLLAQVAGMDRGALGLGAERAVHFGVGDSATENWGAARKQFDTLVTRIDQDVLHFAWVETSLSGQLVARTSINWSGDAQTVWFADSGEAQLTLHQRSLGLAAKTRAMRLRLFVTVAGGAAKIAVLMSTPGGAVLALPAMAQYVIKILAQAREFQSVHPS